jgi:hypothetical protein
MDVPHARLETRRVAYETLQKEWAELKVTLKNLEQQIQEARDRMSKLGGFYGYPGLISKARDNYLDAKRYIEDLNKRRVFFIGDPDPHVSEHVVDKVTSKRVYVRRIGEHKATYYNLDGTYPHYRRKHIDLVRTLGESYEN